MPRPLNPPKFSDGDIVFFAGRERVVSNSTNDGWVFFKQGYHEDLYVGELGYKPFVHATQLLPIKVQHGTHAA